MRLRIVAATIAGVALVGWLLLAYDPGAIWQALRGTGWALLIPIVLHPPQTLASAAGWAALIDEPPAPGIGFAFVLRWIKEAANALLPVAQIGGDVVRVRLFAQGGGDPRTGLGATLVDVATELAAQIVFTLGAVLLVVAAPHDRAAALAASVGAAVLVLAVVALAVARRLGAVGAIERMLVRAGRSARWHALGRLDGLGAVTTRLLRQTRRLWMSGGWHLLSWSAGAIETYAAMAVLGLAPTVRQAIAVEAVAQCLGAADVLVPAALGVREGGYLLIGTLFGIAPHDALALSFVRRAREIALGLPALLAWQRLEHGAGMRVPATAASSQ